MRRGELVPKNWTIGQIQPKLSYPRIQIYVTIPRTKPGKLPGFLAP